MSRQTADPSAPAARDTQWPIFVLSLEGDEARRAPRQGFLTLWSDRLLNFCRIGIERVVLSQIRTGTYRR